MNISKREKALIIIVILLALFGAYYLYYLKPNMDNIHTLKAEIENKKIEAAANEQQKARVGHLNAQIADVNEQIALFGDSIAQAFDQPPILVYLSDTVGLYAQKASISFMQPEQVGEIERCTITIAMVSTYDGLKQVLAAFADAPYLLRVTGLSAEPPKAADTTEDTGADGETGGAAGEASDLSGQTAAGTDTNAEPPEQAVPDVVNVQLDLDFFSLSGSIPANTTYSFETGRQYGGDIFY